MSPPLPHSFGTIGVAPGTPVYSLKVLDGNGKGSLSQVLEAVQWAATEGIKLGIRVLNLSLAAALDPTSPDYEETRAYICDVLKTASDAGIAVVIAAGNYAQDLHYYLPANCPGVASVTGAWTQHFNGSSNVCSAANWLRAVTLQHKHAVLLTACNAHVAVAIPAAGCSCWLIAAVSPAAALLPLCCMLWPASLLIPPSLNHTSCC